MSEPVLDLKVKADGFAVTGATEAPAFPEAARLEEKVGRPFLVSDKGIRVKVPETIFAKKGSVVIEFFLADVESTLTAPPTDQPLGGTLFELPFVKAHFWVGRNDKLGNSHSGINFNVPTTDGKTKLNQLALSRLEGNKPYQLIFNWDVEADQMTAYLQGVPMSDMAHWGKEKPPMDFKAGDTISVGGRLAHEGKTSAPYAISRFAVYDTIVTPEQAADLAQGFPNLDGEARTIYESPLDLSEYNTELIFEENFSKPIKWVHEHDLLDAEGKRVKVPGEDIDWVLEGAKTTLESTPEGVKMTSGDPEDRKLGHMVLWYTKPLPEGILVEYEFQPKTTGKGLHIVFLNGYNPKGGLFDLDLPARQGNFREYIMGEINSYHISPWAADDKSLRRTANMRKNSGFSLVAIGNDIIGGAEEGFHKIRALKEGPDVKLESNGVLCIQFKDDGKSHGPIWNKGGHLGFRFMAHTEEATLRNLKVYRVTRK